MDFTRTRKGAGGNIFLKMVKIDTGGSIGLNINSVWLYYFFLQRVYQFLKYLIFRCSTITTVVTPTRAEDANFAAEASRLADIEAEQAIFHGAGVFPYMTNVPAVDISDDTITAYSISQHL